MTVAVMGCVVNGPGESKHANIGISLPGTGERPVAPVYEDGEKTVTLIFIRRLDPAGGRGAGGRGGRAGGVSRQGRVSWSRRPAP